MQKNQIELTEELLLAAEKADLAEVETLLQKGADPLGSPDEGDPDEHILGQLFCYASDDDELAKALPNLVQLFYDYGMDISSRNIPFDDGNNINPLWNLAFCPSEAGLKTLKVMLDNGLDVQSAEILIDHIFTDMEMCDGCEIEDAWFRSRTIYALKMGMLAASYSEIMEQSEYIRSCLELEKNTPRRLGEFRNWNAFDYEIDISTCDNIPFGLRNATVRIFDLTSNAHVWTLVI